MATINLFGASGHARVVMDIIKAQSDEVGCLYDDNPHCAEIHGKPAKITSNEYNMQNASKIINAGSESLTCSHSAA